MSEAKQTLWVAVAAVGFMFYMAVQYGRSEFFLRWLGLVWP